MWKRHWPSLKDTWSILIWLKNIIFCYGTTSIAKSLVSTRKLSIVLSASAFVFNPPHHSHSRNILLQWRPNGRNSVSNHQPHDCLLNRLFRRSNVENVSIWWRHHVCYTIYVHSFERHNVLHRSSGIGELGGFRWELAATLAVAWLLVFLCLAKGIKTSGKVIGYTFGGKLLGHVIFSAALHAHAGMGCFWHLLITVTS